GVKEAIFVKRNCPSLNRSLLVHLENGYLMKGLDQLCSHLHFYHKYVDNIYNAKTMLEIQLKKNKAFIRFKKLQEARPEFNNQKLEDLLRTPLQRIKQYNHFLQDLTGNTSPQSPDFEQLSRATAAVSEVSQRIHDNTQRHENHLQLCRVQKLLKGRKTKVLAAGRWFIREGWLKTVPAKGTEAKPRMFFLFSDMLLQAKRCSPLHPTSGQKFAGQHAYPLQDAAVEKVFGHTTSQGGLLSVTFPRAKLLLMSTNQQDLNDWYQCLSSTIRKLRSKQTVVLQSDELSRRALRLAVDTNCCTPGTKRNMINSDSTEHAQKVLAEAECSPSKKMKPSAAAERSSAEASSSCEIL
ncbi:rho guanine nucleotide exchange factor 39, partial [Nematolebias whitei]|uniref:rho guanine nucleotide exchange factor 39 n=1 Tax=Nematolebias whitei TaxID=451745 RepID=UPI00189721B8